MSVQEREEHIKLHMLASLARSQRALARMLEACADVGDKSPEMARRLADNAELISKYQRVLTEKVTGIRIRRLKNGAPGKPWLNAERVTAVKPAPVKGRGFAAADNWGEAEGKSPEGGR